MRVAGQGVQHDDHVVAVGRQFAPALHGDGHVLDDRAVLQVQRPDIDHADFTFGGQTHCFHVENRHQNAAVVRGSVAADALNGLAAANPCSRSARMSSMPSMPTASRTSPGVTPVASCSSGVSCACVVDAG